MSHMHLEMPCPRNVLDDPRVTGSADTDSVFINARLKVVDEGITQPTVVGTSCGILILLFLIQPLGTYVFHGNLVPF